MSKQAIAMAINDKIEKHKKLTGGKGKIKKGGKKNVYADYLRPTERGSK